MEIARGNGEVYLHVRLNLESIWAVVIEDH